MANELDIPMARWALPLVSPARYKGASGGRASGKSHFFAEYAVEEMVYDPDLRFVCIREVQRALKYSAKSLIESKIRTLGVEHLFEVLATEIRRRDGNGLMIFEGMQDHTHDSIKSLEGFGRAWVEEAHSISERSLALLLPTIRTPDKDGRDPEIWFSWNPDQPTDPVDIFFNGDPEGAVRTHNTYMENPFCPKVMHIEASRLRRADPDSFGHIWGGGYFLGGMGRVYKKFMNKPYPHGNIDEGVEDTGAEILVGMDFNVNPMSAVIAVRVADECHVLDALEVGTSNTDEMCEELRRRYPNRTVIVCPDPSGKARKTSAAGQTDFSIIQSYGFQVRAPNAAPAVRDRENNANAMYETDDRRRVRIHPDAKPLITAAANLTYKEDTSIRDKKSGFDHILDAMDYLLWQEFNVLENRKPTSFSFRV